MAVPAAQTAPVIRSISVRTICCTVSGVAGASAGFCGTAGAYATGGFETDLRRRHVFGGVIMASAVALLARNY